MEVSTPLVSIGIPVYNAGRFIADTLKSVLDQTYTNFELIITDDGSTDDSVAIVKTFDDQRIQLISDGLNKGISFRLNQQVAQAKGKYFVRMDADDLMFPYRLERQVSFLEQHPELDAVGSSVVVLDDDNHILAFRKAKLLSNYRELFSTILFNHPTVTGKTEFFKKYPYSEHLTGVEDADVWLRSFPQSRFSVISEPLLFYRDPLAFKLSTYRFRLLQKNRLLRHHPYLKSRFLLKTKLMTENFLKIAVATFTHLSGNDRWMISRRNQNSELPQLEEWRNVLKKITNEQS
ncbi:glycosyltransferase family 2 protein [Chryseobacterium sp.]|uniref:glycosyltransferase family 2 protein n=1 Tax=Chryseobacterium sp. TaxID=1871047 RepID=UPI0011C843FA|nr:glycosyltransferase [Chryseobacterium sp.]TXF77559.1 glycosyltransferase [Chryseobacterium sp.]